MPNARIPRATRKQCFLLLFAEDVDPDKELRRYHGLDLEVKGFVKGVKGAFKCSLSLASDLAIQSEHVHLAIQSEHLGVVRTEM